MAGMVGETVRMIAAYARLELCNAGVRCDSGTRTSELSCHVLLHYMLAL